MREKLQSIFASGNQAAICFFEIEGDRARLISTWKSSPGDSQLINAVVEFGKKAKFIVNPDLHNEKTSFLKRLLQRYGIESTVSKPIQPIEGILIINELFDKLQLQVDGFGGWPRLEKLLNRADESPSPEAMAMFQAAVALPRVLESFNLFEDGLGSCDRPFRSRFKPGGSLADVPGSDLYDYCN